MTVTHLQICVTHVARVIAVRDTHTRQAINISSFILVMRLATVVIFITMISGRLALIKTIFKGNRAQTTVALEARGYQEKRRRHWISKKHSNNL